MANRLVSLPRQMPGFSLIEMLVALVILSISLGALYQAATGAIRNVRIAAEYTDAVMLADSILSDQSYVTKENYSASGQFQTFQWAVSSWPAPYEDGGDSEEIAAAPPLQYLQVVVSWPGRGGAPREIDLLTVVPLREPSS